MGILKLICPQGPSIANEKRNERILVLLEMPIDGYVAR